MTCAAIYLRVSTEDQARKYSLDAQREACHRRAVELGAAEVREFTDPGVSGEILERPGLTRLRAALAGGEVGLVVALDPDRLARKLGLQILLTEEIEQAGARLDFVDFEWKQTEEGQLYYHMRGAFAQYEKAKIRRRTSYGRQQKARRGELPQRFKPYGYRFDPVHDTLQIDEAEAAVVRLMFRWVLREALGPYGIACRLQAQGVPTPGGAKQWYRSTVRRILANPVYAGRFLANRWDCTGMGLNRHLEPGRRHRPRLRPEADWIAVPVPALVAEEEWTQAQRLLARGRGGKGGRERSSYLLSGLVRCGECGLPMHGSRTHRRYYTCRSTDGAGRRGCGHWAAAGPLEEQVWAAAWGAMCAPAAVAEAYTVGHTTAPDHREELAGIEAALARQQKAREAYLLAMQRGEVGAEEATARLASIRTVTEGLERRRLELQASPKQLEAPPNEVALAVARLGTTLSPAERHTLLRMALDRVEVGRTQLTLHLRVPVAAGSAEPLLRPADADQDHERRLGLLLAQPDHAGTGPDR